MNHMAGRKRHEKEDRASIKAETLEDIQDMLIKARHELKMHYSRNKIAQISKKVLKDKYIDRCLPDKANAK